MTESPWPEPDISSKASVGLVGGAETPDGDPREVEPAESAPRRSRTRRRLAFVGAVALVATSVVGGWAVLRDRSTPPTLAELEQIGWSACFVLNFNDDSQWLVDEIWDGVHSGELSNGVGLSVACGVDIRERDDVWTITFQPEDNPSDAGFQAVKMVGEKVGCLTDGDVERLGRTRAIDGMVDGDKPGTSWTYSPSSGLALICDK